MEMVKVPRAPIVACLTCPLCSSLLEEATTISECLHSFCRDCIHVKLSDDDAQSCPICDVDLGVAPLEKLRPDPQLDEVRNKLFHMTTKRREATGSPSSPRKRKERTLSSLGLLSAPSSSRRKSTVSRSQYFTRTSTKDISSSDYESEPEEDFNSSDSQHRRDGRAEKDAEVGKSGRASTSREAAKSSRASRGKGGSRRRRGGRRAASSSKPPIITAVWFSLKPADNQSLPALPTPYLRITDGRLPVSVVKKYLATKLSLDNETEVEITCRGQPIISSLPLENVQKIWLVPDSEENSSEAPAPPTVQQFLLTLTYSRKTQNQEHERQQQEDSREPQQNPGQDPPLLHPAS